MEEVAPSQQPTPRGQAGGPGQQEVVNIALARLFPTCLSPKHLKMRFFPLLVAEDHPDMKTVTGGGWWEVAVFSPASDPGVLVMTSSVTSTKYLKD